MNNRNKIVLQLTETHYSYSSTSTDDTQEEVSSTDDATSVSSSDTEDVDLLLFPLMQYLTSGKRRCRLKNFLQTTDSWTDLEFKQHLRLQRNTALNMIRNGYILCIIHSLTTT